MMIKYWMILQEYFAASHLTQSRLAETWVLKKETVAANPFWLFWSYHGGDTDFP
jgi:hypothetical protein